MPSSTTRGFPYPTGGDPVANVDLDIKALADFLEANVRAGVVSANTNASGDVAVAFGSPMAAIPSVVASSRALAIGHIVHIHSETVNGFTARFRDHANGIVASAAVSFNWQAVVK